MASSEYWDRNLVILLTAFRFDYASAFKYAAPIKVASFATLNCLPSYSPHLLVTYSTARWLSPVPDVHTVEPVSSREL
jgi:hypothetical protein